MTQYSYFFVGCVALLITTACTPVDGTRTTGGIGNDPNNLPLSTKTTATKTSTLGGVAL